MSESQATVKLARNNASIDALILTKDCVIPGIATTYNLPLSKIAFIGDEVTDILVMQTAGIGYIGAPANAQDRVMSTVKQSGGHLSQYPVFDGFVDFYTQAQNRGISLIVSDKDGVLKEGGTLQWGPQFKKIALKMGLDGRPYVCVLTGSGLEQNLDFMREYGLTSELEKNPAVKENPYLLMVETGAIHVNVLTGETKNYVKEINSELLTCLKGPFTDIVLQNIEKIVLPEMGFSWSSDQNEQTGRVYVPNKESMLTINVPRKKIDGSDFRKTRQSDQFRDTVIAIMSETAEKLHLPYKIL